MTNPKEQPLPIIEQTHRLQDSKVRDYRAVISQIKKEVLIEISGYSSTKPSTYTYVDEQQGWSIDSLSYDDLQKLLTLVMNEADKRGLLNQHNNPLKEYPTGSSPSLLALLLHPPSRKKYENLIRQTAVDGFKLLEQANHFLRETKSNILNIIGDIYLS